MPPACPGRVIEPSKAFQKRTEVWLPPSVGRRSISWGLVGSDEPDQYPERFLERDFFGAIAIEDSSDPDASACERVWNVQVARCEARTPRPLKDRTTRNWQRLPEAHCLRLPHLYLEGLDALRGIRCSRGEPKGSRIGSSLEPLHPRVQRHQDFRVCVGVRQKLGA